MDIIVSHKSALEYWRLHCNEKINDSAMLVRKNLPANLPNLATVREAAPSGLSYPICLMVSSKNAKRKSKIIQTHLYTGPMPKGCFISTGNGIAVISPAFCFFQMADELPLVKLIELGLELCGSYSLHVKDEYNPGEESTDKALYGHPHLTSIKALNAFASRMEGVCGQKKVSRALRYIAEGSASPMETILFMLLTLPYKLGGYGLPAPELNKRINIGNATGKRSGKAYYVCDLLWPKANFAIEYDSNFYHVSADRIAGDAMKRLDLATRGIIVITVTSRQIRNLIEFEILAKLIAKKVGRQLKYKNPQFRAAQLDLRNLLLSSRAGKRDDSGR